MSQLKKGAALNYITIILTNLVGLLITPYMIRQLGNAEFGLYSLVGALVGYIAILDFGLGHTIIRFVAKYKAENDKKGEENFLATTMAIYLFISIIVILIGAICNTNLEFIFQSSLNNLELEKAKIMFIILIFNLAIVLPGGAFDAILQGYEQFVFPKALNIIKYIVRSIMLVGILYFGGKAISIVILDTIMNMIIIVINGFYVFKKLKVTFKLHKFETHFVKEIFKYSFWIFIFMIIAQFQWRSGQMVLGIISDTTSVAIFAVGIMLGGYYGAFSSAISSLFIPRATQMTVAKVSNEELTDMMIRVGRISFISLIFILGAFLLFGKQFVFLWVGEAYYDAYIIALIIMFAYTVPLVQGFANAILEARNMLAFKALIYFVFLILGTILGAILAKKYNAIGMISGIVFGWFICQNIMNIYYQKTIGLNIIRFFNELFNKTILGFVFSIIIGLLINQIPGFDWFNFIIKAVLFTLVFASVFYFYVVNNYEKELVNNFLTKLKLISKKNEK
ncbi:lipopolysaccharide biosynthesis protein [Mariniflexile sp.]|uniref:lipopolysaccharide biosynthesis protein n=1 Tax=Mariniflexile sp. TaxID=1979402 RepID=UPI0035628FDB